MRATLRRLLFDEVTLTVQVQRSQADKSAVDIANREDQAGLAGSGLFDPGPEPGKIRRLKVTQVESEMFEQFLVVSGAQRLDRGESGEDCLQAVRQMGIDDGQHGIF